MKKQYSNLRVKGAFNLVLYLKTKGWLHEKKSKKSVIVFLLVLLPALLISALLFKNFHASFPTSSIVEKTRTELSILEAIKLAYPSAKKWNKKAQLHDAINIDLDKPGKYIGNNGKRKYWSVLFGVPDTNKLFLVIIHEGKIDQAKDFTHKGDSPYPRKEFIRLEDLKYDSPQLLKKALKIGGISPGKDWAKGYNFRTLKDLKTGTTLILVIGWNNDHKKMVSMIFNATNGEYLLTQ